MKNGSSGILRRVNLIRTDVSEGLSASFIRVTKIGELGNLTQLATDARCEEIQPPVPTRPTRRNIPKDVILQWI
jgi:hypothetical protein